MRIDKSDVILINMTTKIKSRVWGLAPVKNNFNNHKGVYMPELKQGVHFTWGDRLSLVRRKLGMQKGQIATLLGVVPETYGKYESDRVDPPTKVISILIDIGVDPNFIYTGNGEIFSRDIEQIKEGIQ